MVTILMLEHHLKPTQKIASAGHSKTLMLAQVRHGATGAGDTNAENDQESCERESYQIQVGPGDTIPGVSPHIGRIGVGYSPINNGLI